MAHDGLIRSLVGTSWHVVVIGAGPAGCVAAALLAGRGRRVLLVEKSKWPREKVCGGCLNHSAIQTLRAAGLGGVLADGENLDRVEWRCGRREIAVPMPSGVAMLRSDFDAALAAEAEQRGCTFLSGVSASLQPGDGRELLRTILLRQGEATEAVTAEAVLACDGIGGTSVGAEPWAAWKVSRRGWIGVAATLGDSDRHPANGAICMHIGAGGYAGLVRLADGRVHLAAALDPRRCRREGGPAGLIEKILGSTGVFVGEGFDSIRLHGTGAMTRRRRRLGGHRVLAVGDACGYVEPFTGEGMAWAMRSAAMAAELLPGPGEGWSLETTKRWESAHAATIGPRQRQCRAARAIVHHPGLASALIGFGSLLPWMTRGAASHMCGAQESLGGA